MIGITIIRLVGAAVDMMLTPAGFSGRHVLLPSLWAGWALTLGVADTWIRVSRVTPAAMPAVV